MADMDIISPNEELAALMALQRWYEAMGVDDAVAELPRDYFAEKLAPPELEARPSPRPAEPNARQGFTAAPEVRPRPATLSATSMSPDAAIAEAIARADAAQNLDALRASLETFEGASVRRAAIQLVFGRGDLNPQVMVIGETPDSDDDKSGLSFSGLRGVFLGRILAAIGMEKSAYLTHLVPWRPAGNAMPSAADLDACLPFAHRHIALVKPKALICLGWTGSKLSVSNKLTYALGDLNIPVVILPELHELMRSGARKRKAWDELLAFKRLMA